MSQSPQDLNVFTQASQALTATGNSGQLNAENYAHIIAFANVTAVSGTTPSMTLSLVGFDAFGTAFTLVSGAAITATGVQVLQIGPGMPQNTIIPATIQLNWTITGTTPSFTTALTVQGRRS